MIGIRLADHSVFPVFASDTLDGKRLVLTTARDNQERVDIELVYSADHMSDPTRPVTIGTVSLDDLQPAHGGDPEIEVVLRRTSAAMLEVTATNRATGNVRSVSIDIDRAANEAEFSPPQSLTNGFEPELAPDPEDTTRSRGRGWLLIAVMLLVLGALAAGAWWLLLGAPGQQSLPEPSGAAQTAPEVDGDLDQGTSDQGTSDQASSEPASSELDESPGTDRESIPDNRSAEYRIRRGDTLRDISETFYGTP